VSDNGIGIARDKLDSIFEAFSQEDSSTTRKFGGTGLGLTICARLVEAMGGRIWVHSEAGRGSVFHFTVWLGRDTSAQATRPQPVTQAGTLAAAAAPAELTILLVEDHVVNQKLATVLLKRWGHRVVVAANGQIALDFLAQQTFNLVLMDMMMPVMDGLEATRRIRAGEPHGVHLPIIAMTANALDADRERCLQAGMDDYLSKPIHAAQLRDVLARHAPVQAHATHTAPVAPSFDYQGGLLTMDEEIREIITPAFVAQWPVDRSKLHAALEGGDMVAVLHTAHALKGTLGMFGAAPAREIATRMESLAQQGAAAELGPLLAQLCQQVQHLLDAMATRTTA